jgi:hypothetical protein
VKVKKISTNFVFGEFKLLTKWEQEKVITSSSNQELIKKPRVIARIQKEIENYNTGFGSWE